MALNENVVARLKRRIDDARSHGFKVRLEPLDGQQATWCVIAGVPTLFVDLSQTAAEQLQQLEDALDAYGQMAGDGAGSSTSGLSTSGRQASTHSVDQAA